MEVHIIIQEARIKTIPKKKKCKKAKWLSEEVLQIAMKKKKKKEREAKGKGEKERYPFECSFKEQQREIRKPSSVINAKKQRTTIE